MAISPLINNYHRPIIYVPSIAAADDDPGILELYQMLWGDKYRLILVKDGIELTYELERGIHDIALTDNDMPRRDGIEAVKIARQRNITTPIIVLSAKDVRNLAYEAGATDYLAKPFDLNMLEARVEKHLPLYEKAA